ncbi:MAG: hypothetical protein AAGD25_32900 [Cyanobacteria bacterium P01_F01_bin.150]
MTIMNRLAAAVAFGIGALSITSPPSHAYYDEFQPPAGFYLSYQCYEIDAAFQSQIFVDLKSLQGGLALEAYYPDTGETVFGYGSKLTEYLPEFEGPRAPAVLGTYQCSVIDVGVNPDL